MMKRSFPIVVVALVASFGSAFAEDVPDNRLQSVETREPVYKRFSALEPSAVATVSGATGKSAVGEVFADAKAGLSIGSFLTDFPVPAGEIDWPATLESAPSPQITVFPSAEDPTKRILLTAGGDAKIVWKTKKGETFSSVYRITGMATKRPFRLFATRYGEANEAAFVSLSGNFVSFYGSEDVLGHQMYVDNNPTNDVIYGFDYRPATQRLTARYLVENEKTGAIRCPSGQFVLVYFSTDRKDQPVAAIPVEIVPPNVRSLKVHVGEEIRPEGGGWDVTDLKAIVRDGYKDTNDLYSPYLEQFSAPSGEELSNPNHGKIFAITPTDASTSRTGEPEPWKADVFWTTTDTMGTRWTFENDWYLISWPEDAVNVAVSSVPDNPGMPWIISSNYVAEVNEYYREPKDLKVSVESLTGQVKVSGSGKIVMRLLPRAMDRVWYFAANVISDTEGSVHTFNPIVSVIGREITPRYGLDAGTAAAASARVDPRIPGFINERASIGKCWNPRLYHAPLPMGLDINTSDLVSVTNSVENADPYAKLQSAIYPVNDNGLITVWWSGSVEELGGSKLPEPITYPALVQEYKPSWEATLEEGVLPELAVASFVGSNDSELTANDGYSAIFRRDSSTMSIRERLTVPDSTNEVCFTLALYPETNVRHFTNGRLLTLTSGTTTIAVDAQIVTTNGIADAVVLTTKRPNAAPETTTLILGQWGSLAVRLAPTFAPKSEFMAIFGNPDGGSTRAVQGLAIGNIELTDGGTPNVAFRFKEIGFEADETPRSFKMTSDVGYKTLTGEDCSYKDIGSPSAYDGRLFAKFGVMPEIYYQNVRDLPGYNPNEEHAFLTALKEGGYGAWALRCDLNVTDGNKKSSYPVVFAMHAEGAEGVDGKIVAKGAMKAFRVVPVNAAHPAFTHEVVAGDRLTRPGPLGAMLDPMASGTRFDLAKSIVTGPDCNPFFKDRKNVLWARRDGTATTYFGYRTIEGFAFPSIDDGEPVPVGTEVPWLSCLKSDTLETEQILEGTPVAWLTTVRWPDPAGVPGLRIAEILTTTTRGLPEVWNAASMAVAYPLTATNSCVTLIDPTIAQKAPLPIAGDFVAEYGFKLGKSGNVQLRKGKYYFQGLPPSISDRFYVDANAAEAERMVLIGDRVEIASGGSYLRLNVLSAAERAALKDICVSEENKAKWETAVDQLALSEQYPTTVAVGKDATGKKEMDFAYVFPTKAAYEAWRSSISANGSPCWVVSVTTNNYDETTAANVSCTIVHAGSDPGVGEVKMSYKACPATWKEVSVSTVPLAKNSVVERSYKKCYAQMLAPQFKSAKWGEKTWEAAIASEPEVYQAVIARGVFTWKGGEALPKATYVSHVNYGLIGNGDGTGYVTLVENDNPDPAEVKESLPVSMKIIKVIPELHADGIAVVRDALNKLSERLTLLYRTPLGAAADQFEFEWRYATPDDSGRLPADKNKWQTHGSVTPGLVALQLGDGPNLQDYVNTYYTLRYRPKAGTPAFELIAKALGKTKPSPDDLWSAWAPEQLAEGWLQRVLNAVTPFAQRVEDFYENPSDAAFTMLEQIGGPYQGDVALNNDNLKEVGLLELYRTLLNRASKIFTTSGLQNPEMAKQMLLAVTRIGELYTLLGEEAYSDAKNPLIPVGDGTLGSTSVFAFQNQEPSLLDEELALLRGRTSDRPYPRMGEAPLYNRLAWNFTKGLTEGEAAYVANYGIRAENGVLDVNCAARQYPQGHGDAYGHFLSGVKTYYHLLDCTNFVWVAPKEMLMDQTVTSVDYDEIEKFATLAHRLAKTGCETMDLTARRAWRETDGNVRSMREDKDANQAFGYGEWATRTAMGAVYNWMAAGAVSPTNRAEKVAGLVGLTEVVRDLERKLVAIEAGRNPLGFDENAIPFDIDPDRLAAKNSHFEQILERAEVALKNAEAVVDRANRYGNRLVQIQKAEETTIAEIEKTERDFKNRLIAIYGTPYPGDIGAGGTYPQGYDGPDLYNYNYMDVAPYGIPSDVELSTEFTKEYTTFEVTGLNKPVAAKEKAIVVYDVNSGGIRVKPDKISGIRATEGSVQTAYRDFLVAYGGVLGAIDGYKEAIDVMNRTYDKVAESTAKQTVAFAWTLYSTLRENVDIIFPDKVAAGSITELTSEIEQARRDLTYELSTSPWVSVAGVASGVWSTPEGIAALEFHQGAVGASEVSLATLYGTQKWWSDRLEKYPSMINTLLNTVWDYSATIRADKAELATAVQGVGLAVGSIQGALSKLSTAEAAYRQEVYKGETILEEREAWRKQVSNGATEQRYLDMFNRVQRNNALTQYQTTYDVAQRYVWELAKVYDYETGLLSSDPLAGSQFLSSIVGSRNLGEEGLDGIVGKMKANWDVLKGRLGVNNPDVTAKTFSLRYELFRIDPGARGDTAWKQELRKYWTDDINANADFARHCQPLASDAGQKEPGLVIPFSTSIDTAKNFFGRLLQGGDHAYSTADYATKIAAVGVSFDGYDRLTEKGVDGLAADPNVYLVPVGTDYLRAPTEKREVLGYDVVDQVMPLPYAIGSTQLDDENWVATFAGLAGGGETGAKVRRHATLTANGQTYSTRLVGRSVWNDKWLLVIPAASLNANRALGLERFIEGVSDIKLGIRAYSRSGN